MVTGGGILFDVYIILWFTICFFFFFQPLIASEQLRLHAQVEHRLSLMRRTSQFAPIRKKIWLREWGQNLALHGLLTPPSDFPSKPALHKAWRVHCMNEFLQEKSRYIRSRDGDIVVFKGNSSTTYRQVRFDEKERSGTFRRHDGSVIVETYFKFDKRSFRPLRKLLVFPYRDQEARMTLQWEISFLSFQFIEAEPAALKRLIPRPWVRERKEQTLPISLP